MFLLAFASSFTHLLLLLMFQHYKSTVRLLFHTLIAHSANVSYMRSMRLSGCMLVFESGLGGTIYIKCKSGNIRSIWTFFFRWRFPISKQIFTKQRDKRHPLLSSTFRPVDLKSKKNATPSAQLISISDFITRKQHNAHANYKE